MKNVTLKAVIESTNNLSASLILSTVNQFGGWEYFKERAEDIARYGAAGGFSGFTYYSDTVAFAKRNKKAILASLSDLANELGEPGAYTVIAGFNCLKSEELSPDDIVEVVHNSKALYFDTVMNALAWYALEEVARAVVDYQENN